MSYIENPGVRIYTAKLAKKLLSKGHKIINIKPMKNNPDRTMFIFERNDELLEYVENCKNKSV